MFGNKHYNTMGILGYHTFLLSEDLTRKIIGKQKQKPTLLDIGAGDGGVTKKFESYVSHISYIEPSESFQKTLNKRGYSEHDPKANKTYGIVNMMNVLDRCDNPETVLESAKKSMGKDSICIISLPFPICVSSWDNSFIRKNNHLNQEESLSFESAVSDFYTNFLEKNGMEVTYFTRLPYIVLLPEIKETTVYDNGLFVCKKK